MHAHDLPPGSELCSVQNSDQDAQDFLNLPSVDIESTATQQLSPACSWYIGRHT